MKKIIAIHIFCFLFFIPDSFSQTPYTKYWIQFTDKNNNPFSVNAPSRFLSAKALDRRKNQLISIQENDLPLTPAYIDSIAGTGAKILNKSKWFNAVSIQISDTSMVDSVLKKIVAFSFVAGTDTVSRMKKNKESIEEKVTMPDLMDYKTADFDYGLAFNQINMIKTNLLHELGYRGKGMTIAVLDNGFYGTENMEVFNSLRNENRLLGTWDFVTGDDNVYDDGGHGTNVLSTMAADLSGTMVGTAPKANYWLLNTEITSSEYPLEEDNWVAGAEFADSVGADIINSSLGYFTFDDTSMNHTYADMNGNSTRVTIGADIAASKGILVCNSAGNEGQSPWQYIIAPADGDSVLAVGAVDENRIRASFSSIGPSFDGRIKPNVAAQGKKAAVANPDNSIGLTSGTSFSSPITAGSSACLWQAFPEKNNMEIIEALQKGASQFNAPDNLLGYGILNLENSFKILNREKFISQSKNDKVSIVPNPFTEKISFIFYSAVPQKISIEIIDEIGKTMFIYEKNISIGDAFYKIEISDLKKISKGIYFLRMKTNESQQIEKLVKM